MFYSSKLNAFKKALSCCFIYLAVFFGQGSIGVCYSQDIHFSQSHMMPLLLNPSLAGVFDGSFRGIFNYKNQWQGMGASGATFNTGFFSCDTRLEKSKWQKGYLALGFTAFKDVAGDLKLGTTQLNISLSGTVFINKEQSIAGSIQGGYVQKSISVAAMQWENQYDTGLGAYNSGLLSNEAISPSPISFAAFSSGLSWRFNKLQTSVSENNQLEAIVGLAAFNINTPKQSFYSSGNFEEQYTKIIIHGESRIGIKNSNLTVSPSAYLLKQGPSYEINIGTLVRWALKNESTYTSNVKGLALSLGANYRMKDAFIPMAMLEYSLYAIGISYDVNTSSLFQGTTGKGGIEISLRLITSNIKNSPRRLLD